MMGTTQRRSAHWVGLLSLFAALTGCGSATTLTVRPTTPSAADLVPTPAVEAHQYKRLLVLPPSNAVAVDEAVEAKVAREKSTDFYVTKVEKTLLGQGFEAIAQEIVARAAKTGDGRASTAERALIMGKETQADAVLMIQNIRVVAGEKFFDVSDLSEVEPGLRKEEDGSYEHRRTGD